mmetsp:Transcript_104678/g.300959  ORF Transcript_104678/g.300959 Transcript_104678/m.300959 type:complete len:244 (-) Transcript_104678:938-1669(-)
MPVRQRNLVPALAPPVPPVPATAEVPSVPAVPAGVAAAAGVPAAARGAVFGGLGPGSAVPALLFSSRDPQGLLDHPYVVTERADQLHMHVAALGEQLEVQGEDFDPVDEFLGLCATDRLEQLLLLLQAGLLAELLNGDLPPSPMQRVHELNPECLQLVHLRLRILYPVGEQEHLLVHLLGSLLGVGQRRLCAGLELDQDTPGCVRRRRELEDVFVLLEDVQQLPILEVRVLLELRHLEVGSQL